MRDYTKIDAWKLADELVVQIYEVTRSFPKEELYGLVSQLRRAAASVPANIAEGSARGTQRDYLHFLYIARGSLTETQYFLHLSSRLGFTSSDRHATISEQLKRTFACLHALTGAVERESSRIARAVAKVTGLVVLAISHLIISRAPVVP
jgi:four helix bundle protein